MTTKQYPVLVLCGSDKKRRKLLEELDPERKYKSKALLPFLGKRVIDWQLEAFQASPYVKDIYLLGLTEEDVQFKTPVHYIPVAATSRIDEKLIAGLNYLSEHNEDTTTIIVTTSDTPGLETKSIDVFFDALEKMDGMYDGVVTVVPEQAALKEFSTRNRVVARFRDHQVFPGELFALSERVIIGAQKEIRDVSQIRRLFNRQKQHVSLGPILRYIARKPGLWVMIIKYLLRTLTLEEAEAALSRAFQFRLKAVIIPDPGFGMDMDLPEDYQSLETYVRRTKLAGKSPLQL
ncbi:MAG: NTP transferase domain-containing protein [Anaerolineales bacterium]